MDNSDYTDVPRAFTKVWLLFILVVFVYILIMNFQVYWRNNQARRYYKEVEVTLAKEQGKNSSLKKELLMYSEQTQIERLARDRLGLVKKGETAFRIID